MFQFKASKIPFQPSSIIVNKPFPSSNPSSPKMAGQQPLDIMDRMVDASYAPLVLPQPLNALPRGDYKKYFPRFKGHGETTAEEHWDAFLSYVDNQNIEAKDVWMRIFV